MKMNKYYLIPILLLIGFFIWFKFPIKIEKITGKWKANLDGNVLFIEIKADKSLKVYSPDLKISNNLEIIKVTSKEIITKSPRPGVGYRPPEPIVSTNFRLLKEEWGPRKTFKYTIQDENLMLYDVGSRVILEGINCNFISCY